MKTLKRIIILSTFLTLFLLFVILTIAASVIHALSTGAGGGGFEIMESDTIYVGQIVDSIAQSNWNDLNYKLSEYDYNLYVTDEKSIAYSSLDDKQVQITDKIKSLKLHNNVNIAYSNGMSIIAKTMGPFSIYAIKGIPYDDNFWGGFMSFFTLTFLIFTVIIMISSYMFARKMAWRILRPLRALTDGANRIEYGDLSQPIEHKGNDEFSEVCLAFNHMQESLIKEREKNATYEKAQIEMVAGISHDLRTPLTSVKGYIKGLRDGVANTKEKKEQYLAIAYKKACDVDVLLQKLFYFSKLQTGNLPLFLENKDLGLFVRDISDELKLDLPPKGISLEIAITASPHMVMIDIEQMRRVISNLVENAEYYSNVEKLHLKISVWKEGNFEHLLFSDNGKGVLDSKLPYLFDRFWRGDESRCAKNNEGSGLGLYIVKYIVEAHGGFVNAKNHEGLTIDIALPCRKES